MEDDKNNLNCNNSYIKNKSNSNLISVKTESIQRKSTCPNIPNNHLVQYINSKFSTFQTKKTISKKRKEKKVLSMNLNKEKYLLKNINDERLKSMIGIKKKFKESLIFTEYKIKEIIEKY